MICESQFLALPECKICKGRGWYIKKIETEEDQDEHGVEMGERISVKCSFCRLHMRRREMFLTNKSFHNALRFFEFSDYQLPDESQVNYLKCQKSLDSLIKWTKDIKKYFIDFGGFIYIVGDVNAGKTISAHIIAREAYVQGYMCNLVSLPDLSVDLSHRIEGTVAKNTDGKVVFDLEDYVNCDILCVDNFELINDYFQYPNIRRALIFRLFRERLQAEKPTIVISQGELNVIFTDAGREIKGYPYDFPPLISKHYRNVYLYGKFKKEVKARSKKG